MIPKNHVCATLLARLNAKDHWMYWSVPLTFATDHSSIIGQTDISKEEHANHMAPACSLLYSFEFLVYNFVAQPRKLF